jgi:Flp pilus assembly protein TadD
MERLTDEALWSVKHLGHALLERERLDEAEAVFVGLTALAAQDAYAWQALGQIARLRGDIVRAQQLLEHALKLAPRDASCACALGELLIGQQRHAEARRVLQPFVGRAGDGAHERRARALYKSLARR